MIWASILKQKILIFPKNQQFVSLLKKAMKNFPEVFYLWEIIDILCQLKISSGISGGVLLNVIAFLESANQSDFEKQG